MTASWLTIIVKLFAVVLVILILIFYLMFIITSLNEYHFTTNNNPLENITPNKLVLESTSTTIKKIEEKVIVYTYDQYEVEMLCKVVYGEARGIASQMEQAAVIWCILNRVDSAVFPNTIAEVITSPGQFTGYKSYHPVTDSIKELTIDVLTRWYGEKHGVINSGRVLPREYVFFYGNGEHNIFRTPENTVYNWHLANPYIN